MQGVVVVVVCMGAGGGGAAPARQEGRGAPPRARARLWALGCSLWRLPKWQPFLTSGAGIPLLSACPPLMPHPTPPHPPLAVYAIYLLAVRPYNVAVVGGFELTATVCTLCMLGLAMAVMDGRGESDLMRWVQAALGTVDRQRRAASRAASEAARACPALGRAASWAEREEHALGAGPPALNPLLPAAA